MAEITRDELFRQIVFQVARRSTCPRRHVGALLVRENRIISTGYNGAPSRMKHCEDAGCDIEDGHCVRAVHAEANAILFAAKEGISTQGAALYITDEPCIRCAQLIINAGIEKISFVRQYSDSKGLQLLMSAGLTVLPMPKIESSTLTPWGKDKR